MQSSRPSIGIIGAGPIGRGVCVLLHRAGYRVTVGTQRPDAARRHGLPAAVAIGTAQQAADAEVVIVAVRHPALPALMAMLRGRLAGKVVIDTCSAWILRDYLAAGLSDELTEGCWLARQIPEARVSRAFSHIDYEVLVSRPTEQPGHWAAAYAADDPIAGKITARLLTDVGYVPVRVGALAESAALDVGGVLWPYMFTPDDMVAILAGPDTEPESHTHAMAGPVPHIES